MLIIHPPDKPLVPTRSAEDWKAFLADPEKHWKDGRSAKLLAECWEASRPELPQEFREAFSGTPFESFLPLLAIPEYCVDLPGGSRPSQNDLFVLGRIGHELAVLMVEGKVDESFGPLLGDWLKDASPGKKQRLDFLKSTLGLSGPLPDVLRYQLLHRTASPLIEAYRFCALYAAMVVHSFSESDAGLEDYQAFARLLGAEGTKGSLEHVSRHADAELWIGWVSGRATPQRLDTTR
jgi:uncharacterized protein DUF6946